MCCKAVDDKVAELEAIIDALLEARPTHPVCEDFDHRSKDFHQSPACPCVLRWEAAVRRAVAVREE
jgi:hypothetical protein